MVSSAGAVDFGRAPEKINSEIKTLTIALRPHYRHRFRILTHNGKSEKESAVKSTIVVHLLLANDFPKGMLSVRLFTMAASPRPRNFRSPRWPSVYAANDFPKGMPSARFQAILPHAYAKTQVFFRPAWKKRRTLLRGPDIGAAGSSRNFFP